MNLEANISAWRRQMLAAGIKAPVPLEELEIHLREEIERRMKSGLGEQEIFNSAVQKIGQGKALKDEFKKMEGHKIKRAIMLIIGWLAAGFAFLYGTLVLDFDWNLFSFHPKWNGQAYFAFLLILAAETGIWFLAKVNCGRASQVVSLLICLFLAGIGISGFFHVERGIFGGVREIPFWYRGGGTLLWCLPGIFWVWWERRRVIRGRSSSYENLPISN
jgi:hypothetical protein